MFTSNTPHNNKDCLGMGQVAFTTIYGSNWHPLHMDKPMLDIQFSAQSCGHHFTNLFLHILAPFCYSGFLQFATGKVWTSMFSCAHICSASRACGIRAWWRAEDVLSAVFWFPTLWAYVCLYTKS